MAGVTGGVNGDSGATRAAELAKHPRWKLIEERLRLRMSPRRVLEALTAQYPGETFPEKRRLQRFKADQAPDWFVSEAAIQAKVAGRPPAEAKLIEVIADRQGQIDALKIRIATLQGQEAKFAESLGNSMPYSYPEVLKHQEQLRQLLRDQASDETKLMTLEEARAKDQAGAKERAMARQQERETGDPTDPNRIAAARLISMPTEELMPILDKMFPSPPGTDLLGPGDRCQAPHPHRHGPDGSVLPPDPALDEIHPWIRGAPPDPPA